MTITSELSPVLVTGGTGRSGARLVRHLTARNVAVRIGTRHAPAPFDWNDPRTWIGALDGVKAAYLCYSPDLAVPGASESIAGVAAAATEAGVQRLVLLSGRGEEGARAAEDHVRTCGLEWTVLRCSWFAQNFSEHFLLGPVRRGRLLLPADGGIAEPFVDLDDLAEVAADSLTTDRHVGRLLELTGPRLLTLQDVAAELSAATGRPVEFVSCTAEEFAADLADDGIPGDEGLPLAGLFTEILDGRNAVMTTDLAGALNREPTDFGTYAARAAGTGVWNAPARASLR
ncbi:NmrA family transcriptional regulator [Cryobacterium adonitolivorans]|uniref:NmrA family transcriptional regulator n=1 Tax=Cryobacterium adonitolivorans TaxID=1259189 RepID=A0A4R8W2V4_9MICO|nr:NmrA family NAD(P)-binding protein [Cryobacterium adonitolivorans]TFB99137.1 NmrA family transcriptional regulator [Cryobacterium adonitolivorans]